MSRPCTDLPITRVSVTNDGALVVEVVAATVVEGAVVDVVDAIVVVVGADVLVVGAGNVDVGSVVVAIVVG